LKKNIFLKSIKDDHADGYRSGSGLVRSILGELEIPSQKNRTFITIWRSWFSYEFPLIACGNSECAEYMVRMHFVCSGDDLTHVVFRASRSALALVLVLSLID